MYRKLLHLASGGLGEVDLVVRSEPSWQRLFARKRIRAELASDPVVRSMFLDEARIAGLVRHPNVVAVTDVGQDEAGPFFVMEYVEGVACSQLLARGGPRLPVEICVEIAMQTAAGLDAIHECATLDGRKVDAVHRDISPANLMLGFDGVVRITDLGIARSRVQAARTQTGVLKGKMGYLAPEQLLGHEIDRRTDLFGLGVVLYELLAGERLYRIEAGEAFRRALLVDPPPDLSDVRPDVPTALVELCFELLAKNPEHRPAAARDVHVRLEDLREDLRALGATASLAELLEARFGEARAERATAVRHAMAQSDETGEHEGPTRVDPAPPGARAVDRRRAAQIALGGVALLAVIGIAIAALR